MGEAADKIEGNGGYSRVAQLRGEITRKREILSEELDELRRRRADAVALGKQSLRMAAGTAIGMFIISSLANAAIDLLRKDSAEQPDSEKHLMRTDSMTKVGQKQNGFLVFSSAVATIIINEMRKSAVHYAKRELREQIANHHLRTSNGNGDYNGHIRNRPNSDLA